MVRIAPAGRKVVESAHRRAEHYVAAKLGPSFIIAVGAVLMFLVPCATAGCQQVSLPPESELYAESLLRFS